MTERIEPGDRVTVPGPSREPLDGEVAYLIDTTTSHRPADVYVDVDGHGLDVYSAFDVVAQRESFLSRAGACLKRVLGLDIQWITSGSDLPPEAERNVEQTCEHLAEARGAVEVDDVE